MFKNRIQAALSIILISSGIAVGQQREITSPNGKISVVLKTGNNLDLTCG